jgi:hypothetical protein
VSEEFTRIEKKALILAEFHEGNYEDPQYANFFRENDLGIPLSVMWIGEILDLDDSPEAWDLIDESFESLCKVFGVNPNKEYQDLEDLLEP